MAIKIFIYLSILFVGMAIGVWFFLYLIGLDSDAIQIIRAFASALLVISLFFTVFQFDSNRKWSQKDAAIKGLYASQHKVIEYMDTLSTYIDLRQMMRNQQIVKIEDIHNAMGVFVKLKKLRRNNGDENEDYFTYDFIFHGEGLTAEDIHTKDNNYTKVHKTDVDGKVFEKTLLALLNEYEYISLAARQNIFDKKTVIELIGPNITRSFYVLQYYIMHLRGDSRHGKGRSYVYEEFQLFYKEIEKYQSNKFKVKSIYLDKKSSWEEYKVPFRLSSH